MTLIILQIHMVQGNGCTRSGKNHVYEQKASCHSILGCYFVCEARGTSLGVWAAAGIAWTFKPSRKNRKHMVSIYDGDQIV